MAWKQDSAGREEIRGLIDAIERQAREAVSLGERAQRDMGGDRFASYLDFRKKVEEARALATLTEDRLRSLSETRIDDLRTQFEKMDLFLIRLLSNATRRYFASMRDDQILPIGARELFEPELRIIEEMRLKLSRPQYAEKVAPAVLEDLDATAAIIQRICARAPALPDFSDAPSPPKPVRRLRNLGRPVRP